MYSLPHLFQRSRLRSKFHVIRLTVDYCITEGHFILQRPMHLPANDLVDETYLYGSTANGTREPHHGVEFPNQSGTPVYAAANGTVIFAGPDKEAIYSSMAKFLWQSCRHPTQGRIYSHYMRIFQRSM